MIPCIQGVISVQEKMIFKKPGGAKEVAIMNMNPKTAESVSIDYDQKDMLFQGQPFMVQHTEKY